MTDQDLVGGAADPGQVNALSAFGFGHVQEFFILCRFYQHFRKHGLMSVNHDVHILLGQNAQIYLTPERGRGAEQDILKFCGDHRTAPSVSQGCP